MKKKLKKISEAISIILSTFPSIKSLIALAVVNIISWIILKDILLMTVIGTDIAIIIIIVGIYSYRFNLRKSFLKDGTDFLKKRGVKAGSTPRKLCTL